MCAKSAGEFDLIDRMTRAVRVFSTDLRTGIGDDCAVIAADPNTDFLLTSDMVLEDVHFKRRWFLPEEIGGKALRAALSDIAAMGGSAEFALVSMAVPAERTPEEVEAVYRGIREAAELFAVTLAGGDLSGSPGGIFIDITLIGKVAKGRAVLRSGARAGDRIFVSGTLGDAAAGLRALEAGLTDPDSRELRRRQCRPEPRLALGRALAGGLWVSAMIDVSDGLSSDLGHLCRASGVGARVEMDRLPVSEVLRRACSRLSLDETFQVLHGGEDYELLFTVPARACTRMIEQSWPVPVRDIGEILPASEGILLQHPNGRVAPLRPQGYDHFLRKA